MYHHSKWYSTVGKKSKKKKSETADSKHGLPVILLCCRAGPEFHSWQEREEATR